MNAIRRLHQGGWVWLIAALALACAAYAPGLSGAFIFDDYPNIVDNHGVQPTDATVGSLVRAALSSPSSDFKRPLASLSFAANYLASGLDPYWMKLTNLVIHLLNGCLFFLLARALLRLEPRDSMHAGVLAAWIAGAWLVLPVNLTAVLYVVQRMESLANLFVLLGLLGYIEGRRRMLASSPGTPRYARWPAGSTAYLLCAASITVPTAIGVLAKETAVMLPLYAMLIEWILFAFRRADHRLEWRMVMLFALVLAAPMVIGLAWLLPGILRPEAWATRDFTLGTRLLSEARIVADYIAWVLVPLPGALSFYHDDFHPSAGLFQPWTTFAGLSVLLLLAYLAFWLRTRRPLAALGILLFLGCHLLTGTILPLELIYEHRNYFASFGLLLAVVPALAALAPPVSLAGADPAQPFFALARRSLLLALTLWWIGLTFLTASAWGDPLHLAEELAARAPRSPRAQYELGRTYIIYSHYDTESPFTRLAYEPLERAAALPGSSILPQQALIFMNSRMRLPLRDAWWDSMISKLKAKRPGVQDESSLAALAQCAEEKQCVLPEARMVAAFEAALSHPSPNARLLAIYGGYAWNVLQDHRLGLNLITGAIQAMPSEPAYRITLVRMLVSSGQITAANRALDELQTLNIGGRLDDSIASLQSLVREARSIHSGLRNKT